MRVSVAVERTPHHGVITSLLPLALLLHAGDGLRTGQLHVQRSARRGNLPHQRPYAPRQGDVSRDSNKVSHARTSICACSSVPHDPERAGSTIQGLGF